MKGHTMKKTSYKIRFNEAKTVKAGLPMIEWRAE